MRLETAKLRSSPTDEPPVHEHEPPTDGITPVRRAALAALEREFALLLKAKPA